MSNVQYIPEVRHSDDNFLRFSNFNYTLPFFNNYYLKYVNLMTDFKTWVYKYKFFDTLKLFRLHRIFIIYNFSTVSRELAIFGEKRVD